MTANPTMAGSPGTTTMKKKKFRIPPQLPPVFTATEESLVEQARAMCDRSRKLLDGIVANVTVKTARFDNVLKPMAASEDKDALEDRIIGFYQAVSTDEKLRDASAKAEQIMQDYGIEAAMREDLFGLVDAVFNASEELDPESKRLLEKARKGYISFGLGIPKGEKRDRFKEIKKRLSQLSIQFSQNLNNENNSMWFTKEELRGVPDKVVNKFEKGIDDNKGKLRMTFKYPDFFPVMKFAQVADVRKRVYMQHDNNLPENLPLFKETIALRDEAARLLGYPNHAAFVIEDKMAKTPKTAFDFLNDLRRKLTAGGKKEVAHLLELKKEDLHARDEDASFDGSYYAWDHKFYDRLMVEKEYSVDEQKIAEYFSLTPTIEGMFRIFERLFGLEFIEVTAEHKDELSTTGKGSDITWHEEASLFAVWNDESEGGEFVGYLYLDLHPRQGKYGHAANFELQPGFTMPDGSRRYPVTALVCNFPRPTDTEPSLLPHSDVTTLFHELGHGIHDLVARTKYSHFHGTATVRDFVEAPSQMLENWCWTPSQLKSLSKHHATGEPIPDDLIAKQIASKHVNAALFNLRQLHFGIYDMTIHTSESHEAAESMELSKLYNTLRTEISGLKGPESQGSTSDWGHGQTTFGHLMGGYDAGYYGYLYSLVYATDMFHSAFRADPMNATAGRRYRRLVLEKGGSQDEMTMLENFLGRKPNTKAFYDELGLHGDE